MNLPTVSCINEFVDEKCCIVNIHEKEFSHHSDKPDIKGIENLYKYMF